VPRIAVTVDATQRPVVAGCDVGQDLVAGHTLVREVTDEVPGNRAAVGSPEFDGVLLHECE
jgi:hypothetical protein